MEITVLLPDRQYFKFSVPIEETICTSIEYNSDYYQESIISNLTRDELEIVFSNELNEFKQYHKKNYNNRFKIYEYYSFNKNWLYGLIKFYLYHFCEIEHEQEYFNSINQINT